MKPAVSAAASAWGDDDEEEELVAPARSTKKAAASASAWGDEEDEEEDRPAAAAPQRSRGHDLGDLEASDDDDEFLHGGDREAMARLAAKRAQEEAEEKAKPPGPPFWKDIPLRNAKDMEVFADRVAIKLTAKRDTRKLTKFLTVALKKAGEKLDYEGASALKQAVAKLIEEKQRTEQAKKGKAAPRKTLNTREDKLDGYIDDDYYDDDDYY